MNLSTAVFLVEESARAVRVEYDPDVARNNNPSKLFKTVSPDLKKDDLVVVPTHTRHGFTVAKITEIDFQVDFHTTEQYAWIVSKVDKAGYDHTLEVEKTIIQRVGKAEENKMRAELKASMGLGAVSFADIDILGKQGAALPAPPPV
jgi:hypothetical protein